jgi:ATP-binding cassette, subfamily F, member 3
MSLVQVNDLKMEFGGNVVLDSINCSLEKNNRVGLIGMNGSGKTTLIKLMLGLIKPSTGTVTRARNCSIGYLPQDLAMDPGSVMLDTVRSARPDLIGLHADIERLASDLSKAHDTGVETELNKAIESYTSLGGYEFDNEVKYVLTSLAFPESEWHKRAEQFSGGEQTRIFLAQILLAQYDLLILDEPTNHLDLEMINWLERYLLKQGRPFLVVSHDRSFLDNTVSTIFSLREGKLSITKGNYTSFKEADEIARLSQERQYERQQKLISETRDYIQKFIAGTRTNSAKSRLKMLNRMEIVEKPGQKQQLRLPATSSRRSGNDIYTLLNANFGIGGRELARDISLHAHYKERICILGPNGCGKSTLLKILLGEHRLTEGVLKTGASLDIGYLDQHQTDLDETLTVMETLWQLVPQAPQGYVLSWLARFGFRGDDVEKKAGVLSGGERSRLYLCRLIHENPNLMILDEPTNHLDIDMADALLAALDEFPGTVIFVSHDRWFISKLANRFWVFRKKSGSDGTYTTIESPDCGWERAIEMAFEEPEVVKAPPPPRERSKKRNPWYLEQLHKQIEEQHQLLAGLQKELSDIHAKLSDSATYSEDGLLQRLRTELAEKENVISMVNEQLALLEDQYLEQSYD